MAKTLLSGKPMKREYFVSESWSQATVITKNQKLGIMLDPTEIHSNWDYRNFGDMFFDLKTDSLEVANKIDYKRYAKDISKLRSYYTEFQINIPSTGKDEWVAKTKNGE
jgi:hypothetical protein